MKHHLLQTNHRSVREGRVALDTLFNGALVLAAAVFVLSGVAQGVLGTGQSESATQFLAQSAVHAGEAGENTVAAQLQVLAPAQGRACAAGKLV